jgi:hypothetical protein
MPNPSRPKRNAAFLPMREIGQGHPAAVLVNILPQKNHLEAQGF